jgi:hypothetical protein
MVSAPSPDILPVEVIVLSTEPKVGVKKVNMKVHRVVRRRGSHIF